jgi:hypothetical protein
MRMDAENGEGRSGRGWCRSTVSPSRSTSMTALKRCSATVSSRSTLPTSSPRPIGEAEEGRAVVSTVNRNNGKHQPISRRQASTGPAQAVCRPPVSDLSAPMPYAASCRSTPPRRMPPPASGVVVPSREGEGVVRWRVWRGMQGVSGSCLLVDNGTLRTADHCPGSPQGRAGGPRGVVGEPVTPAAYHGRDWEPASAAFPTSGTPPWPGPDRVLGTDVL